MGFHDFGCQFEALARPAGKNRRVSNSFGMKKSLFSENFTGMYGSHGANVGFLRNRTSLIQTIGRAARNKNGHVILYAERVTASMQAAMEETERRRTIQQEFNIENDIEPKTITKPIRSPLNSLFGMPEEMENKKSSVQDVQYPIKEIPSIITRLQKEMKEAAKQLHFERAAELRDQIKDLEIYALRFA